MTDIKSRLTGEVILSVDGDSLVGANLRGANLRSASLFGADLRGANLSGANLRGANLSSVNLSGANLHSANLSSANLRGADLSSANLRSANLFGADLSGANLLNTQLPHFQIPEGALIVYKKLAGGCIAKLKINAKVLRTASLVGRKCRSASARVVSITAPDGTKYKEAFSQRGGPLYVTGEVVEPDHYDDDIRVECTNGIHFFLTKAEAKEW